MPYFRFRQFRGGEVTPVAGRGGQLRQRTAGEHALVIAFHIRDLVDVSIIAEDFITFLQIQPCVRLGNHNHIVLLGLLPNVHAVGLAVEAQFKANQLAEIIQFDVIAAVDVVCLHLDWISIHVELLSGPADLQSFRCQGGTGQRKYHHSTQQRIQNPFHFTMLLSMYTTNFRLVFLG